MAARVPDAAERRERLIEVYREASVCTRCRLAETRTQVVFGNGNSDADLMFVGRSSRAPCNARSASTLPSWDKMSDRRLGSATARSTVSSIRFLSGAGGEGAGWAEALPAKASARRSVNPALGRAKLERKGMKGRDIRVAVGQEARWMGVPDGQHPHTPL